MHRIRPFFSSRRRFSVLFGVIIDFFLIFARPIRVISAQGFSTQIINLSPKLITNHANHLRIFWNRIQVFLRRTRANSRPCAKAGKEAVFELIIQNGKLVEIREREASANSLSERDTKTARRFVEKYADNIVEKWVNFFVYRKKVRLTKITQKL